MTNVLVVDNDRLTIRFLKKSLEENGFSVRAAASGYEALEALRTFSVDAMIIDLIMPNIDGKALCRIVRNKPDLSGVFIAVLSAVAAEEWTDVHELGADACIAKGPLNRMADHVLAVLRDPERARSFCACGGLFGLEDIEPRTISRELLGVKNHFEQLLSSICDGILEVNADGRVVLANAAAQDYLGLAEQDLLGRRFVDLFDEVYRRRIAASDPSGGGPPAPIGRESPLSHNGRHLTLDVIPLSGNAEGSMVVLSDVTERVEAQQERDRLEERLRHRQKMEAIGTLAGGIAHDFNNLLASILGFTELCLLEADPEQRLGKNLREIFLAGSRARDLVRQILAFSRQASPIREPIDVGGIVRETLQLIRASFPARVEIRFDRSADRCLVSGDPTQIQQVVLNLLTNAGQCLEEREDGGVIRVKLEAPPRGTPLPGGEEDDPQQQWLSLCIADTGPGIPPEHLERIFDPYFTTREPGKGTGLGLSVARGVVSNHGGRITVENRPEGGTRFSVYLPLLESEMPDGECDPDNPVPGGSERILLVEDEAQVREMGRQNLERLGYRVETAGDGKEALDRLAANPDAFDAVVTDMSMPRMDGDRLVLEIRKRRPDMPVLVCTGYSETMDSDRARELGIDALLLKPFGHAELAAALRKILDGQ